MESRKRTDLSHLSPEERVARRQQQKQEARRKWRTKNRKQEVEREGKRQKHLYHTDEEWRERKKQASRNRYRWRAVKNGAEAQAEAPLPLDPINRVDGMPQAATVNAEQSTALVPEPPTPTEPQPQPQPQPQPIQPNRIPPTATHATLTATSLDSTWPGGDMDAVMGMRHTTGPVTRMGTDTVTTNGTATTSGIMIVATEDASTRAFTGVRVATTRASTSRAPQITGVAKQLAATKSIWISRRRRGNPHNTRHRPVTTTDN